MFAKTVRELEVYKLAYAIQQEIFEITKAFPKEELYSLTDQIRRSSRSVGANLSEAWAKRRYPAHFSSKLSDADGESEETIHWLHTAYSCEFISEAIHKDLIEKCNKVCGMLNKMSDNADQWCGHYTEKG